MRQNVREEKGDTYNPICLFDMKSDDEWITKRKILAYQMMFHGWMGAPSNKRKRDPRILIKVDRKGKSNYSNKILMCCDCISS